MARKNKYLKPANSEVEMTQEQMMEFVRCAQDPIYFCRNYVKIVHPKHGAMKLDLYEYQEDMITKYQNNDRVIVMSARQTGKSVVAGAYLAWYAFFHFQKTILIVSNNNDNSMEMVGRIRDIYENLPDWLKPGVDPDNFNKHELVFDNKSRIVSKATTKDSGRGLSISLLYCDELAFVNPHIQKAFWTAINPTLSTGGSAIITSTPNGDQGLFAEIWRQAVAGVGRFINLYVPWDAPPDRDENFKNDMIAEVGEEEWKQEFECQFISSDSLLISSMHLNTITDEIKENKPIREVHDFEFWSQIKAGATYLIGVDPSQGVGNDFSVINIFNFPDLEQIAQYRKNTMNPNDVYGMLKNILLYIQGKGATVYFSIESNGVGQAMIALYEQDDQAPQEAVFISETSKTNKRGFTTSSKSKIKNCITFKQLFEAGVITIKSETLLSELKSYVRSKGSYAAQHGATDDCIASVLIVMCILVQMSKYDDNAYDILYTNEFGRITQDEWESGKREGSDYDPDTDTEGSIIVM